jgi:hypothetical protein
MSQIVYQRAGFKSAVAGIVDRGGGLRVVVGPRSNMRFHVAAGERLFIVPGFKVQEPVPWGKDQVDLIARVEAYVASQL